MPDLSGYTNKHESEPEFKFTNQVRNSFPPTPFGFVFIRTTMHKSLLKPRKFFNHG
jgi:hypothetical protein